MSTDIRARNRGRPRAAALAQRPPAQPIRRITATVELIVCPGCHQGMQPLLRKRISATRAYLSCPLCGRNLLQDGDTLSPY